MPKLKHIIIAKEILKDNNQELSIRKIMDIYKCCSSVAQNSKKFLKKYSDITIEELEKIIKIIEDV